MKKILKILLIIPVFLLFAGCKDSNPEFNQAEKMQKNQTSGFVVIDQNNIDLKEIPINGGKVNVDYVFRNEGKEPLVLMEGETSCMCTEAVVEGKGGVISPRIKMAGHGGIAKINQVLEPGEEAKLIATFNPLAHGPNATGPIARSIFIKTNSEITPKIKFSFQGNVIKK